MRIEEWRVIISCQRFAEILTKLEIVANICLTYLFSIRNQQHFTDLIVALYQRKIEKYVFYCSFWCFVAAPVSRIEFLFLLRVVFQAIVKFGSKFTTQVHQPVYQLVSTSQF